jgi:ketosteroid isomerase-like protein
MGADRKNIVEQINAGFAENNLDKVLSFCADDLVWTMVGDTTVKGKDAIRKWIASMNPEPPQLMIQQMVAEGDVVITRGDMIMKDSKDRIAHTYSFCDIYRFAGDRVVELIAFVIGTDKTKTREAARKEVGRAV